MQGRFRKAELGTAVGDDRLVLGQWEQAERGSAWSVTAGASLSLQDKKEKTKMFPSKVKI